MSTYDYIFTGAGAAALSLLTRMVESGKFSSKRILLIDRAPKQQNDRTWCFWEQGSGYFDEIVYRKWDRLSFHCKEYSKQLDNHPYSYKMIRGIDFYNYCFERIHSQTTIDQLYGEIEWKPDNSLWVDGKQIETGGAIVFNSIYTGSNIREKDIHYLQHFKGWIIDTGTKTFDSGLATLMDFRIPQDHGVSFVYVMPLTETKLLVEYTLFSPQLLTEQQYQLGLESYITQFLKVDEYKIIEEEFGVIPMTSARFNAVEQGRYNIGTAGGQTKASSGYTFQFIQKQSTKLFHQLTTGGLLSAVFHQPKRFPYYDKVLLNVLADGRLPGEQVFGRLFEKNKASSVFRFLDNETTLNEEIKIMSTLPFFPFLKAGIKSLF